MKKMILIAALTLVLRRTGRCSILCRKCRGKCMLLFGGSSRVLLNLYAVMLFA